MHYITGAMGFFQFALASLAICITIHFALRFLLPPLFHYLDPWISRHISAVAEKRECLEKKLASYSDEELTELLLNWPHTSFLTLMAAFTVAEARLQNEDIRAAVQRLTRSMHGLVRFRAKGILKSYAEEN